MLLYKAFFVLAIALVVAWLQWPWFSAVFFSLVVYLLTGGWRFIRIFYLTFWRDLSMIMVIIRVKLKAKNNEKDKKTASVLFQETVKRYSSKTAFIFESQKWTFQQAEDYSNKVANLFKSAGYKKGDVVAVFLQNKPEFICLLLGLGKIGVISALINTNLRQDSLAHCISIARAKSVVFGFELSDAVKEVQDKLNNTDLFSVGETDMHHVQCLDQIFHNISDSEPPVSEDRSVFDCLIYIYTSGTTGWPKAVPVSNIRVCEGALVVCHCTNLNPDDVFYVTLPMYHSAATVLGVLPCLLTGCTLVLKRKFSASNFWKDCVEHKVTVTQYIGEICRYLLAQPQRSWDNIHQIRIILGNGMRPHLWREFQERFKIPKLLEFYGATEGSFATFNLNGHVGSCGFIPAIIPSGLLPYNLFQVDVDTCELKRGPDGMAIRCKTGEPGMAAGKIIKNTTNVFTGYINDKLQSSKKIAQNVFSPGDSAFISGDIMVADELGNLYFKDRLGDTFRWKGENVSTSEVESIIMKLTNHADVVVYGVEVPGTEGRAGMAVISDREGTLDLKKLASDMTKVLPIYARPIFIRVCQEVELTGTFKLVKGKLRKEAFDPVVVQDSLYYMEPKSGQYLPLDSNVHDKIVQGGIRL